MNKNFILKNRKIFLSVVLSFLMMTGGNAWAQVTLTGTSYSENFDGIGTGGTSTPQGWSTSMNATISTLGTTTSTLATGINSYWSNTTAGAKNAASLDIGGGTSNANQLNALDRAISIRQTSASGDPGAAFILTIANTTGFQNFSGSFKLQQLDPSSAATPRTTTWKVQYSSDGTSWTDASTSPSTLTTVQGIQSNQNVTFTLGSSIDNLSSILYIRIVTLTAASGSGNRPHTAIDDFVLNYTIPPIIFNASNEGVNAIDAVGKWRLVSAPLDIVKTDIRFGNNSTAYKSLVAPATPDANYTWATIGGTPTFTGGIGFAYQVNSAVANENNASWQNGIITFPASSAHDATYYIVPVDGNVHYVLTGNPYYRVITLSHFAGNNLSTDGYYTTNAAGNTFPLVTDNPNIAIWQGIILGSSDGEDLDGDHIAIYKDPLSPAPSPAPAAVSNSKITVTAHNNNGTSSAYINNGSNGTAIVGKHDMSFLNMGENQTVQVYTSKINSSGATRKLALNTINIDTEDVTVPLGIFTNAADNVTLTLTGMDSYNNSVTFIDYQEGKSVNLSGLASYDYPTSVSGSTDNRFALQFGQPVPTGTESLAANVQTFVRDGKINIVSSKELQNVTIYSVSGSLIASVNINGVTYVVNSILPSGAYLVRVSAADNTATTQKVVLK